MTRQIRLSVIIFTFRMDEAIAAAGEEKRKLYHGVPEFFCRVGQPRPICLHIIL